MVFTRRRCKGITDYPQACCDDSPQARSHSEPTQACPQNLRYMPVFCFPTPTYSLVSGQREGIGGSGVGGYTFRETADWLLDLHGLSAMAVACKRLDDCSIYGDREGELLWSDIVSELTLYNAVYEDDAVWPMYH